MAFAKKTSFVKENRELKGDSLLATMFAVLKKEAKTKLDNALADTSTSAEMRGFIDGKHAMRYNCPICGLNISATMYTCQSDFDANFSAGAQHRIVKRSFGVLHGGHDSGQAESEGSPESKHQRIGNEQNFQ